MCKEGSGLERVQNVFHMENFFFLFFRCVIESRENSPKPMAAQQSTVTMDKVTFRLVMEWAGRGLRSQHLDIKYNSRQKRERMSAAAGSDPKIPRLC